MKQVPDAIRRRLFPGERVVWFGKSRATRVFLYFAGHIAAAIGWFGFSYFVERDLVFGLGLPILVTYLLLLLVSTDYVLTDSRVIAISPILPPRVLYLNLINDLGAPVPIKFGWIDGIRFGEFLVRQEDRYKYFGGVV